MAHLAMLDDPYPIQNITLGDLVYKWQGSPPGSRGAVVCAIYDDIVKLIQDPCHLPNRRLRFKHNTWVRFENLYPSIRDIQLTMVATGMVNPLVVWSDGPVYRVDRGNQRLTVCRALCWSTVPCRVAKDVDDVAAVLKVHPYEPVSN